MLYILVWNLRMPQLRLLPATGQPTQNQATPSSMPQLHSYFFTPPGKKRHKLYGGGPGKAQQTLVLKRVIINRPLRVVFQIL